MEGQSLWERTRTAGGEGLGEASNRNRPNATAADHFYSFPRQSFRPTISRFGYVCHTITFRPDSVTPPGHLTANHCMRLLLARLVANLGKRQAYNEWRWMNEAVASAPSEFSLPDMVNRRCLGEPLQYILGIRFHSILSAFPYICSPGTQPFGPLDLLVRRPVLIPRPETEHWVIRLSETIQASAQAPLSLLDIGTGSGCIPLLLCHLWPQGSIHAQGIDISPHAIRLANDNALLADIPPPSESGHNMKRKNTFSATLANFLAPTFPETVMESKPPFNIVTSNPPYIAWKELVELPRSVSEYEDPRALFGGSSGFEFYEAIADFVGREGVVSADGIVALEVGRGQARVVEELIRSTGRVRHTKIWKDPWGVERTVIGRT